MAACRFDVLERTSALKLDLLTVECAQCTGRHPHSEHSGRDLRPRGDNSSRGDQGVLTDLGAIENDRSDPDERAISDPTTVHDRTVPDGDLVAEERWKATRRDMQCRLVLDIRALANTDSLDIATQDGSVEDARVGADLDVSDDGCARCDPDAVMQARMSVPKATNDRARPKIRHPIRSTRLRNRPHRYRRSAGSRRESSGYIARRSRR